MINRELMEKCLPKGDKDTLGIVCGPTNMNKLVLNNYVEMGYDMDNNIFKY